MIDSLKYPFNEKLPSGIVLYKITMGETWTWAYMFVCVHVLSYVVLMWQGYVPRIITTPSQSQLWPNTNCKRIFPMPTPINQKIHRRKIEGFFCLVLFMRESLGYIWDLGLLTKSLYHYCSLSFFIMKFSSYCCL